jgi:hypothetical protein
MGVIETPSVSAREEREREREREREAPLVSVVNYNGDAGVILDRESLSLSLANTRRRIVHPRFRVVSLSRFAPINYAS